MRAIQELDHFKIDGYAGTSAGALMAALAAVGYRHEDLISITRETDGVRGWKVTSVLEDLGVGKATELFGLGWWRIRLVRFLYQKKWPRWAFAAGFVAIIAVVLMHWLGFEAPSASVPFGPDLSIFQLAFFAFVGVPYLAVLGLIAFAIRFRGLSTLDKVKDKLDQAMTAKFEETHGGGFEAGHRLTFGDLRAAKVTLKVVAANLNSGEMQLFSTDCASCQRIPVSDAVTASIAVPLLFVPQDVEGELYCDGGIVSNLPAWVFEEETVNDATATVIASHISDIAADPDFGNGFALVERVGRTAAFGGKRLNMRGIRGLITIEVGSLYFKLLDFDYEKRLDDFKDEYYLAYGAALLQLDYYLAEERFLESIYQKMTSWFENEPKLKGDMKLRASLVREIGAATDHATPYQLSHCLGFGRDADRYLSVRHKGSMIAASDNPDRYKYLDLQVPADKDEFCRVDDDGLICDRTPDERSWSLVISLDNPADRDYSRTVAVAIDGAVPLRDVKDDYIDRIKDKVLAGWDRRT